jgi:murein DD-endopeptidase MepM/ murein hydrolase activator NlpD
MYVERPKVTKVSCLRRCATRRRIQGGSTVKVLGSGLSAVSRVIFHGSIGRADDLQSRVRPGSPNRIHVRVPVGAVTGPVSVEAARRLRSPRTRAIRILPAEPPEPNVTLTPVPGFRDRGAPRLETGTSRTKAYYGMRRTVTFSYRITESLPSIVRIELVRAADGAVVQTWEPPGAVGQVQKVVWNGNAGTAPAPPGRYSFRLTVAGRGGLLSRSAQVGNFSRDAFDFYDHQFPIRGRHDYGGGGARFGAGRGGRSHQGHDVFARCGTRMVAARGGVVKFRGYHRAAGNYMVIDGAGTGYDYAYMHLAEPTPFEKGEVVYTGQRIGAVGETGNARGCHLHFEIWGAPGWYDGGRPVNPLPALQAWDSYS